MSDVKHSVYVCEDERELAEAITRELRDRYEVFVSETGSEAMEAARAGRVDVLVMDRKL